MHEQTTHRPSRQTFGKTYYQNHTEQQAQCRSLNVSLLRFTLVQHRTYISPMAVHYNNDDLEMMRRCHFAENVGTDARIIQEQVQLSRTSRNDLSRWRGGSQSKDANILTGTCKIPEAMKRRLARIRKNKSTFARWGGVSCRPSWTMHIFV